VVFFVIQVVTICDRMNSPGEGNTYKTGNPV
jgi:hypothetical protein